MDALVDEAAKLVARGQAALGDDEPPEPPQVAVTRPGDTWALGDHRLTCGDCREVAMVAFPEPIALLVTDPPYGVDYAGKNAFLNAIDKGNHIQDDIIGDAASPADMSAFWLAALSAVRGRMAPGGSYYVTGPQGGDLLLLLLLALRDSGFPLRHMLVWAKNNHVLGRCDYNYKHEPIIFGWVDGAAHTYLGGGSETSLWQIDRPQVSDLHPTMKPVELYARAMRNSSRTGDVVADPFAGSGTAFIAAEQLGRRCYGAEISPHYCDVIVERWENITGGKATRASV